jgi:colanic acid/amylovoran biosynthesis protein
VKIVISHVYSKHNSGDAAILSAQIAMLKRAFDDPQLRILSIEPSAPGTSFDGIPVGNALMYGAVSPGSGRAKKVVYALAMMAYTSLWARAYRVSHMKLPLPQAWREPMRAMLDADIQVCVGGGYLRSQDDLASTFILVLLLHQIWLAKALGKSVYLFAQSFGPYPRRMQGRITSIGLRYADLILVREAKSGQLLTGLGVAPDRVVQVPDSAFTFEPNPWPDASVLLGPGEPGQDLVGVTVRAWLSSAEQHAYESAVAEFIDRISGRPGVRVAVIAQVTASDQDDDDRVVGRRIAELLGPRSNVAFLNERLTHYEIKSVFDRLTYLVGTRFHSVIFALTSGVPALAIEYEHKTSGIMQDLGLEKWVLRIEEVTADNLTELFDELVAGRQSYLRDLRKVLPDYVAEANNAAALIKASYESSR